MSAPPLDPDSSDATALPVVEQSTFAGGEKSMRSAKGRATSLLGRWPQHRSPSASFQRKRTHKESGNQESSQLLPAPVRSLAHAQPKELDEDGFVVPTHIRAASESRTQAFPSFSKRMAIPSPPSSTSSISTDFVICMSSTSTPSPSRTISRRGASYQSSVSMPSPLLLAKIVRLDRQSRSPAAKGWSALDPDQEEEEEEEVNLHSIVRRRLSFGGARYVSHTIEILRETLKDKQNSRRGGDLERLKSPPAS